MELVTYNFGWAGLLDCEDPVEYEEHDPSHIERDSLPTKENHARVHRRRSQFDCRYVPDCKSTIS
jgi:hypothetical protein